jgi:hypothetical protein
MSRRIEHSASYSGTPVAVHGAFVDPDYWQARISAVGGPGARLEGIDVANGGVEVRLMQAIAEEHLPSIVKKVKSGDLLVERTEIWGALDSDTAAGSFTAAVTGTPIRMRGTHALSGDGTTCTVRTTGAAQVAVPLIGGKIEQVIADNLTALLGLEQHFTEQWLTQH